MSLSKDVVKIAGRTMEKNLSELGPYVLPFSEQSKLLYSILFRSTVYSLWRILETMNRKSLAEKILIPIGSDRLALYLPDFTRGIDYFCIHAGGRGVLDTIERNLQLRPVHTEPCRSVLQHYGNTSSSSVWYELDYIRKVKNLRRGERVLQIAFGSGFKCNSAVWLAIVHSPVCKAKND